MSFSDDSSIDELTDSSPWSFFAEGAANLIYQYTGDKDDNARTDATPRYEGKLLRLRKDIPGNPSTTEVWEFLQRDVLPVIGRYYVGIALARMDRAFVAGMLQKTAREGQRLDAPVSARETHAFVMENVLAGGAGVEYSKGKIKGGAEYFLGRGTAGELREIVLEFKPKWLLPSPTAGGPDGERVLRCRTCALGHQRGKPVRLCPLDLASADYETVAGAVKASFGPLEGALSEQGGELGLLGTPGVAVEALARALHRHPLLVQLQALQRRDTRGVLGYGHDEQLDAGFLVATAARDCTLFVALRAVEDADGTDDDTRVVEVGGRKYAAKFTVTDVDIKHPSAAKREYWAGIERTLVDGGWYTRENLPACSFYEEPVNE